ncbi:MAG: hypothetical protein A3C30_03545 [Candidatus Levybacteria bacterium RIFCSPHIGHO2_02_FULL_40_18]|nr:MAG: hypothetical protein A2869_00120 [Candidatus Levybacteria bacterium RIFCSPHIGHO2_01_FULL_40_58]OGH26159.1 MAG: hypothetical protein A3C30_03545 [Candidatus Levybacteria bacterium RIFCSPHIGHO2_02_FULL_40_18]OGH31387.1 MAG: hypothetical protein A3E43_03375 [Candidatus Levybacteria bacterium RIFCSPHIGHO2_12_FULL_40_31]OGH40042.1 MAG: hypothetical protein A2894_03860 [Candidatus Levybacteria bacterium RIFCSPLOWO2_01_FULL_40_64]OGH49007.1 MAG: hypothetical protein A3I54_00325 [Candidatus Lev
MLKAYIEFLRNLILSIPFNIFDYIIFVTLILYIFEDVSFGIIPAAIGLTATLLSFFVGLAIYPQISSLVVDKFLLTKGISDAIGFLLATGVSFVLISSILSILRRKYLSIKFGRKIDMAGGAVFGTLSFFFIASFAVALLLSFPVSAVIKDSIRSSVTGRFLFTRTQGIEREVRKVFGGAIEETINFLTIKPASQESVRLNFTTKEYKTDPKSEDAMLSLVNLERSKRGIPLLISDGSIREVARAHAKDMLERGYFSHYTPEGLSPFDRLEMARISYAFAGENLAFAPDVEIAMDGFMKSPGHRENILSPNFKKGGIGVIDAGIFGKMFVQEFTD